MWVKFANGAMVRAAAVDGIQPAEQQQWTGLPAGTKTMVLTQGGRMVAVTEEPEEVRELVVGSTLVAELPEDRS